MSFWVPTAFCAIYLRLGLILRGDGSKMYVDPSLRWGLRTKFIDLNTW